MNETKCISKLYWKEAEKHLKRCIRFYARSTGTHDSLYLLSKVVNPLFERYMEGDRSEKLYQEIMRLNP